jgi:threonine/homoserine/homoserine lactone efflux protein
MRLAEFLLAVLVMELTPGPNMTWLAVLALSRGRVAGLRAVAGVAAGLATHAVLAALGVGVLVAAQPALYEALRWAGVAFMLWLAWEAWRDAPLPLNAAPPAGGLFWRGVLTNLFNPKSILFFVAVVPGFVHAGPDVTAQLAGLGAVYVGVATAVHASVVLLAARLRPWLVEGRRRVLVQRALAVALAAAALWLAATTGR